ncbi:hypothetical protein MXAN_5216 [Myxococcus xanthus DK 1622]|uniref:DUF676 domain-containing protein n=2 Tax=Myxococcaceae TaxID=31 RepID=Q1D1V5_MYXXD|nr:hypothetical protein MXAN_5216 [Myxococcus xanthus DK 1622]NOJ53611.1 hypothetical protein [Myxococcus xanthus]QPM77717.1 hypothetical protein I5Q59_25810 [Myxococcus xanthus]QVW66784.1 hypothetical protein JTM82_31160 [Myxococcus xanthus DZ2]UEO07088.1 hypothetical protein K1515_11630 [Myxococcus xanthus DZ2]
MSSSRHHTTSLTHGVPSPGGRLARGRLPPHVLPAPARGGVSTQAALIQVRGGASMTSHLVLVPGFGGFDALGSLRYYHGVTEVLQAGDDERPVHYFTNLPTASVQTRAQALQSWLSELRNRRAIAPEDEIHLVGHSTGGLDLRQLLINLRNQQAQKCADSPLPLLKQLRTVQFISTPHQGTALAHRLGNSRPQVLASRLFLRVLYEGTRGLRGVGLGVLGRALMTLSPRQQTADWIDAIIDTLVRCYSREASLPRATARGTYFDLLRWLLHMTSDFAVITDLDPAPASPAPPSPAHAGDAELAAEAAFIEEHHIQVRSIVTVAPPSKAWPPTLFKVLHALTAFNPPQRLRRTRELHELWTSKHQVLRPTDNDGIVNSVSQVWPDEARSYLLQGDHADVIGHFSAQCPPSQASVAATTFRQYDLLNSPAGFDQRRFIRLWKDIGRFTASQQHREATAPRPRGGARIHHIGSAPPHRADS